jgi:hypothetical protein
LAAVAYCAGIDVIGTTPVGTRLPQIFADAIVRLVDDDVRGASWHRDIEPLPLALTTTLVGPNGVEAAVGEIIPAAPTAAELTVRSAM